MLVQYVAAYFHNRKEGLMSTPWIGIFISVYELIVFFPWRHDLLLLVVTETDVDADAESAARRSTDEGDGSHDNQGNQATSMMSRISGVRQSRSSSSSSITKLDYVPPTYGVDDVPDSILAEVHIYAC